MLWFKMTVFLVHFRSEIKRESRSLRTLKDSFWLISHKLWLTYFHWTVVFFTNSKFWQGGQHRKTCLPLLEFINPFFNQISSCKSFEWAVVTLPTLRTRPSKRTQYLLSFGYTIRQALLAKIMPTLSCSYRRNKNFWKQIE